MFLLFLAFFIITPNMINQNPMICFISSNLASTSNYLLNKETTSLSLNKPCGTVMALDMLYIVLVCFALS